MSLSLSSFKKSSFLSKRPSDQTTDETKHPSFLVGTDWTQYVLHTNSQMIDEIKKRLVEKEIVLKPNRHILTLIQ